MKLALSILIGAVLSLFLAGSTYAGTLEDPNWYKRIYTEISDEQLYELMKEFMESEGYKVEPINLQSPSLRSDWKVVEKAEHLKPGWTERSMHRAFIQRHNVEKNKFLVVIDLVVEQLPPNSKVWQKQVVHRPDNKRYAGVMTRLETMAIKAGAQVSRVPMEQR